MTTRIQHCDIIGHEALSQVESRLRAHGYQATDGQLAPGRYSWHHADGAPGWSDWTYAVSVGMLDGHELGVLLKGL